MTNFAYLRTLTNHQDIRNQKLRILEYCSDQQITPLKIIEDNASGKKHWKNRGIGKLLKKTTEKDTIVVSEIACLGKSTLHVLEILELAAKKGSCIHIIKNQMIIDGSIQATTIAAVLGIAAQVEKEFISARIKKALGKKKADGMYLGRPKGPASSLKLDIMREEILNYVKKGINKRAIARLIECSPSTLYKWMKQRKIGKINLKSV